MEFIKLDMDGIYYYFKPEMILGFQIIEGEMLNGTTYSTVYFKTIYGDFNFTVFIPKKELEEKLLLILSGKSEPKAVFNYKKDNEKEIYKLDL